MKNGSKHAIDSGAKHPEKGAADRRAKQGTGPTKSPGPNWGWQPVPPSKTRTRGHKLV